MKGQQGLATLRRQLRDVTPAFIQVQAGDVTLDFSEGTIRVLLNKDDRRYPYRRTFDAGGTKFDIPSRSGGYLSTGDYDGFSAKVLGHVAEHVHTVIRQTRQAYTRAMSALAPEYGLRVLDGEKPEETLVQFVTALVQRMPTLLPTLPASISTFRMVYEGVTLGMDKRVWTAHYTQTLASAHSLIQNLEGLLRWFHLVQTKAKALL